MQLPTQEPPSPQVSFDTRVRQQTYRHNRGTAAVSGREGDLVADYDPAGNLTDLIVKRDGPCLPTVGACWQRFHYEWDELGQLSRARRWDLDAGQGEQTSHDELSEPPPFRPADAELSYAYDGGGDRVLKTAIDAHGVQRHSVYVFASLELRSTGWDTLAPEPDYVMDARTTSLRLSGGGASARVIYSEDDLPTLTSGHQHFFLELGDHLGSTTFIIDHATSELVEYATYQAYGAKESDYRPGRWGEHREPYGFSGKEEDIEVGLAYFGARYYSPYLQRWLSPDPVTIHDLGSDANPYAYVRGTPLMAVDPDGRELISLIVGAIIVGAVVGAGSNVAMQAANGGWSNINVGQVFGSALVGAIAGGVSAGVGSWVSTGVAGAMGAGKTAAAVGVVTGAGAGGAAGGAASYVAGSLVYEQRMTAGGFGKALLVGAAGGLAGGAAGLAAGGGWGGALAGSVGGGLTGYGVSALLGDMASWESLMFSLGAGLAGAAASKGLQDLELWARITGGTAEDRARAAAAMREIYQTETGKELLSAGVDKYGRPIEVKLNDQGVNQFCAEGHSCGAGFMGEKNLGRDYLSIDPNTPETSWVAPESKSAGPGRGWDGTFERQPISLEAKIAHELGHAFGDSHDVDYMGLKRMENVILHENPIRIELRQPPRVRY